MFEDKSIDFKEHMVVYDSKSPFVRKIFWNRINISLRLAEIKDDSTVLDIGCNTGHLLKKIRLVNHVCECWGIDIEPKIMTLKIGCKFKVSNVKKIPFDDNYFSVIFALDVLEHVKDIETAIKEIYRVLKPNGHFILCGPTESWFYKFCRFLQFGVFNKNTECEKPGFRGEIDFHHYTIYELEDKFSSTGFRKVKQRSVPRFPLLTLFSITKFVKMQNL